MDFQTRRDRQGYGAAQRGRLSPVRVLEALYHARHGDRSGQDIQRQWSCDHGGAHRKQYRRNWGRRLRASLYAGSDWRVRRTSPRQELQADAVDADPCGRRRRAPFSSKPARGCGHVVLRNPRDDWLAVAIARVRGGSRAVGVCDVSTFGKIDLQGRTRECFSIGLRQHDVESCALAKCATG